MTLPTRSLIVLAVVLLAGCSGSGGAPTTQTPVDRPLTPNDAHATAQGNGSITVVEAITVNDNNLRVIHDTASNTYCYHYNDESGDGMDCIRAVELPLNPEAGHFRLVGKTEIGTSAFFVVLDDGRGVRCYVAIDESGDAIDCEPAT